MKTDKTNLPAAHRHDSATGAVLCIALACMLPFALAVSDKHKREAYAASPEGQAFIASMPYSDAVRGIYVPKHKGAHDCTTYKPSPDGAMIYVACDTTKAKD